MLCACLGVCRARMTFTTHVCNEFVLCTAAARQDGQSPPVVQCTLTVAKYLRINMLCMPHAAGSSGSA